MKIFNRQFTPRPWAIGLYAVLLLCMLWLGNWQLDRAELKVTMAQAAEAARNSAPIALSEVDDLQAASESYVRVSVEGQYDGDHQFLWDNRTYKGFAGFEVLVPLQLENGQVVIVNRGWIAPGASRSELPDVSLPSSVGAESVRIQGLLSRPSKGLSSGPALADDESWPRLLQYLDYDAISRTLGVAVVPTLLQAQTLGEDGFEGTVLTARPEWLTPNWQPAASGPAKHYSYAFQWFALALALTVIFIVVNLRTPDARPIREEHHE